MAKEKDEREPEQRPQDEIAAKVQRAIELHQEAILRGEDTLKLSSGAEVKLIRLPPLLIQRLNAQFPEPEPPMIEVEVHGKKEMQSNPDDPDHIKAKEEMGQKRGQAMMDLALIKGLDVKLPKDESWLEELRLVGIEVSDGKAAKKLAYIESQIITDLGDLTEVVSRVLAMSGVSPQAVDEAAKTVSD